MRLLQTNTEDGTMKSIPLSGILAITCIAVAAPMAVNAQTFTLDPTFLDFGSVLIGHSLTLPLTITSADATAPLSLEDISFDGYGSDDGGGVFSIIDIIAPTSPWGTVPVLLEPGESATAQVCFTPDSIGPHSGFLTIFSDHHVYSEYDVPLSGEGLVPVPSAVLLGVLGLATAGWKLRKPA
jgi:hypothetical protein